MQDITYKLHDNKRFMEIVSDYDKVSVQFLTIDNTAIQVLPSSDLLLNCSNDVVVFSQLYHNALRYNYAIWIINIAWVVDND